MHAMKEALKKSEQAWLQKVRGVNGFSSHKYANSDCVGGGRVLPSQVANKAIVEWFSSHGIESLLILASFLASIHPNPQSNKHVVPKIPPFKISACQP